MGDQDYNDMALIHCDLNNGRFLAVEEPRDLDILMSSAPRSTAPNREYFDWLAEARHFMIAISCGPQHYGGFSDQPIEEISAVLADLADDSKIVPDRHWRVQHALSTIRAFARSYGPRSKKDRDVLSSVLKEALDMLSRYTSMLSTLCVAFPSDEARRETVLDEAMRLRGEYIHLTRSILSVSAVASDPPNGTSGWISAGNSKWQASNSKSLAELVRSHRYCENILDRSLKLPRLGTESLIRLNEYVRPYLERMPDLTGWVVGPSPGAGTVMYGRD